MKTIIVGLGVQGHKRRKFAAKDVVAIIDPVHSEADYKTIFEVPLDIFDSACLCIPDEPKFEIIQYLLSNEKHILVEKPLFTATPEQLDKLITLAESSNTTCYTAYNHRFEPHFHSMMQYIKDGSLGDIYSIRMFYGNGTARLVRDSEWRDQGSGVIHDLGSHLLDTIHFWIGRKNNNFELTSANRFENRAYDHAIITSREDIHIQLEMSLLSWRNEFFADVYGSNGSAHIKSLCKWGPSELTIRKRRLPSGRPDETTKILIQDDPTWDAEYKYFKSLCTTGSHNLNNDRWINNHLNAMELI